MVKLELKEGAGVYTSGDEQVGKVNGFVLHPSTNEITHIIVQKGWVFTEDKVVPLDMVGSATDEKVILRQTEDDFNELPPFEEQHFVRTPGDDTMPTGTGTGTGYTRYGPYPGYYWYPPYGYGGLPGYGLGYQNLSQTETEQNIPDETVPINEGTDVISSDDKHVGDVERVLVDPGSKKATHFVISQGMLFKDHKLIPVTWVGSVTEDKVHLIMSSEFMEGLPEYKE